jgi:transcriptional regulator GlxA family with amidase domain
MKGDDSRRDGGGNNNHLRTIVVCERLAKSREVVEADLAEIARRSGYTRRSLELIFKRSVGASPGRWFVNIRPRGALRGY